MDLTCTVAVTWISPVTVTWISPITVTWILPVAEWTPERGDTPPDRVPRMSGSPPHSRSSGQSPGHTPSPSPWRLSLQECPKNKQINQTPEKLSIQGCCYKDIYCKIFHLFENHQEHRNVFNKGNKVFKKKNPTHQTYKKQVCRLHNPCNIYNHVHVACKWVSLLKKK